MKRTKIENKQPEESEQPMSGIRKGSVALNVQTQEFGVVRQVIDHCLVMPVRCTSDGKLCLEEIVVPEDDCVPALPEQKICLQRLFNGQRLCWDPRKTEVRENSFLPGEGERVRISVLGEPVATGIFKQVDDKDQAVFYCLLMEDGTLRSSQSEILGPANDYQFQPIGSTARNKLCKAMQSARVVWNGHLRRFEPKKVSPGRREFYYYLDEYLQIRKVQDTYKPRDRKRKAVGNYFATYDEAQNVQECCHAVLRLCHGAVRKDRDEIKGQEV